MKITIEQLAYRIASRINSVPRRDRDFSKSDFCGKMPETIYAEFTREFPDYSRADEVALASSLEKMVEA